MIKKFLAILFSMVFIFNSTLVVYAREPIDEDIVISIPEITEPINITEEELEDLLNYNLSGYAYAYLNAQANYCENENRQGLNAIALVTISALESGWGRSKVAYNKNNLFGWRGKSGYSEFKNFNTCIDFCADKISSKYIEKGRDTFDLIGPIYCDDEWAVVMNDMYEDLYMKYINNKYFR